MYVLVNSHVHHGQLYGETDTLFMQEEEAYEELTSMYNRRFGELLNLNNYENFSFNELRTSYLDGDEGEMGVDLCPLVLSAPLKSLVLSTIQQLARLESTGLLREQWHAILDAGETFSSEHERLAAWAARENPNLL